MVKPTYTIIFLNLFLYLNCLQSFTHIHICACVYTHTYVHVCIHTHTHTIHQIKTYNISNTAENCLASGQYLCPEGTANHGLPLSAFPLHIHGQHALSTFCSISCLPDLPTYPYSHAIFTHATEAHSFSLEDCIPLHEYSTIYPFQY